MAYIVIGRDATDENALERRLQVRPQHIEYCSAFFKNKTILYACALMENGKMIGSVLIFEFATRQEVDTYLAHEPYVKEKIWATIEINEAFIPEALRNQPISA